MFPEVEKHVMKGIKLDHSIPLNKVQAKIEPEDDTSLFTRPYQKYLETFREKVNLKTMRNMEPDELDTVVADLWNVIEQKSETARIDILQKCLRVLLNYEEQPFVVDESKMLVEEEIKEEKLKF